MEAVGSLLDFLGIVGIKPVFYVDVGGIRGGQAVGKL
jgi:hypothetical protein